jgi:phospholipid transport system substrate-binding protein
MRNLATLAVAVGLLLASLPAAWAGPPTETVREYTDAVQKVLDDPALRKEDRRASVRKIAAEAFDVNESARRALGLHWQQRTPAEREEFVQLFGDLLERTYIAQIDLYSGERLRFTEERLDGNLAIVRAKLVTKQGTEVPVEARMNRKGERWLIYDVAIENVSLISNYRSQFDRIIRQNSYPELIKRLRTRGEMLQEKDPKPGRAGSS